MRAGANALSPNHRHRAKTEQPSCPTPHSHAYLAEDPPERRRGDRDSPASAAATGTGDTDRTAEAAVATTTGDTINGSVVLGLRGGAVVAEPFPVEAFPDSTRPLGGFDLPAMPMEPTTIISARG